MWSSHTTNYKPTENIWTQVWRRPLCHCPRLLRDNKPTFEFNTFSKNWFLSCSRVGKKNNSLITHSPWEQTHIIQFMWGSDTKFTCDTKDKLPKRSCEADLPFWSLINDTLLFQTWSSVSCGLMLLIIWAVILFVYVIYEILSPILFFLFSPGECVRSRGVVEGKPK